MVLQRPALGNEKMDEPGVSDWSGREINAAWNLTELPAVIIRGIDRDNDCARFDPEFLRQRGSRVTGHGKWITDREAVCKIG